MTTIIAAYFPVADRSARTGDNGQNAVTEEREPMGDAVTIMWATVGVLCVTIAAAFFAV